MSPTSIPARRRIAIVAAVVGGVASLLAISSLVGHTARLVDLVGLFASAFAAGAGLVVATRRSP